MKYFIGFLCMMCMPLYAQHNTIDTLITVSGDGLKKTVSIEQRKTTVETVMLDKKIFHTNSAHIENGHILNLITLGKDTINLVQNDSISYSFLTKYKTRITEYIYRNGDSLLIKKIYSPTIHHVSKGVISLIVYLLIIIAGLFAVEVFEKKEKTKVEFDGIIPSIVFAILAASISSIIDPFFSIIMSNEGNPDLVNLQNITSFFLAFLLAFVAVFLGFDLRTTFKYAHKIIGIIGLFVILSFIYKTVIAAFYVGIFCICVGILFQYITEWVMRKYIKNS